MERVTIAGQRIGKTLVNGEWINTGNNFWNPQIRTIVEELVGKYEPKVAILRAMRHQFSWWLDNSVYAGSFPFKDPDGRIMFLNNSRFQPNWRVPKIPGVDYQIKPLVIQLHSDPLYNLVMDKMIPRWRTNPRDQATRVVGRLKHYTQPRFAAWQRQTGKSVLSMIHMQGLIEHGDAIDQAAMQLCQQTIDSAERTT